MLPLLRVVSLLEDDATCQPRDTSTASDLDAFLDNCARDLGVSDATQQCAAGNTAPLSHLDRQSVRLCSHLGTYFDGTSFYDHFKDKFRPQCLARHVAAHDSAAECGGTNMSSDLCSLLTSMGVCAHGSSDDPDALACVIPISDPAPQQCTAPSPLPSPSCRDWRWVHKDCAADPPASCDYTFMCPR